MRHAASLLLIVCVLLAALPLSGCGEQALDLFFPEASPTPTAEPTSTPTPTPEPTPDPAELARQRESAEKRASLMEKARTLSDGYFYAEASALLREEPTLQNEETDALLAEILAEQEALVPYTGELRHIFFHSLIVYPEMIFRDLETPMGGYNSGFSEKAELERILPQLYERGYVLYDLEDCFEIRDGQARRKEILLPPGKTPLILSVDDVAYAYGEGFASRLYVDENGALLYEVPNPQGGVDIMPDGDVMGVVDAFVQEHPDFSYRGHKGTIALTGFQGAFGYGDYDDPACQPLIAEVAEALKADGWNFASHSYTHNNGSYGFWGSGCIPEKIEYDINKWVDRVTPWIGETHLFIAPFGYRAHDDALRHILNAGFDVYCTVDDHVVNELNGDHALMSRIEIGGYSLRKYKELLREYFFEPDDVLDTAGRPPLADWE